jgi:predicted esterase
MRAFQQESLASLHGMPILVLAGRVDTTVPVSRGQEIPDLLRSAGADVQLEWVEAAHEFCNEDADQSSIWLARHNANRVWLAL